MESVKKSPNRLLLLFLALASLFSVNYEIQANKKGIIIAACTVSISAAGIYGLYRYLRCKESFEPSILNLNTYTITQHPKFTQNNELSKNNKLSDNQKFTCHQKYNQKNDPNIDSNMLDPDTETMDIDTLVTRINKNRAPDAVILSPPRLYPTYRQGPRFYPTYRQGPRFYPTYRQGPRFPAGTPDISPILTPSTDGNPNTAPASHNSYYTPSIDKNANSPSSYLNKTIVAHKGIKSCPNDPLIFIFSRGYARTNTPGTNDNALQKGGGAKAAYIPIQDGVINDAPCVTFDYPDRRRCFNFGQKKDLACLKFIYEETLKKNPQAEIILIGDCRGAKAILNFTTQKPEKIKALVLLSPFFSAKQLTDEVARNYLSWFPGSSSFLQQFFKVWFPSYDPNGDNNFVKNSTYIDQKMPIFIAHRTFDTLVSTQQVTDFVSTLQKTGHHNIRLVMTDDTSARHSRLTPVKKIQYETNKFFSKYQLPYNPDLLSQELVIAT